MENLALDDEALQLPITDQGTEEKKLNGLIVLESIFTDDSIFSDILSDEGQIIRSPRNMLIEETSSDEEVEDEYEFDPFANIEEWAADDEDELKIGDLEEEAEDNKIMILYEAISQPPVQEEDEEDEEEIENTPDETSEDEEVLKRSSNKRKRRKSSFFSDPEEGSSRNVRPKRSAKARVVKEESEDDDEEEEKVPYRGKSRTLAGSVSLRRMSEDERPLRQATKRALRRFQDNDQSSDEARSPRKGRRHQQRRRYDSEEDDDEEEQEEERPKPRRRQRPVAEESEDDPPLQLPAPRSVRPSPSSRTGAVEETGVTISAADSSTDLIRLTRARDSPKPRSDISDQGSSSRRPQRKRVKPARLQEYDDGSVAGPGRTGRRNKESDRFRPGEKRSGEEGRSSCSNRYEEETVSQEEKEGKVIIQTSC